ncbi:MlaD family protein [Hydrogenimonas thermophila]|uniref:Phospholipid/cholesterol/gamma-HCH transport system substrate-binding protein n=1 Tax=Hydrogenimonas thermophila TaxID=223786 RepID=A0A1I5MBZ1_9BACT|nr:MlaD family protein [Hydrogenimonas thermophila]WOE70622.1 MlaD family protein [Hydrogenimonas thermophila]WOE73140.1 MlaD family protein [Hydrogenimonas thermophila]SFP06531.1 phospholipid/cholesterol/gamma-HCH transport system substrate-binding protein [Hydrogenimonas thermophila]
MKTEAKVGLFIAIGLVFLFLLSTQVNKFQGFTKKGYEIEAVLTDASGLENHAKVKMKGVEVGYINLIKLYGNSVLVRMKINEGVKIPEDSTIILAQESLLGGKYVNILPGSSQTFLEADGILKHQKRSVSLEEMGTEVALAAEELKHFIHELRMTLNDQSRQQLKETFSNLEKLTKDLKEVVERNKENIDDLVKNINDAAKQFGNMSSKFSTSADTINADLPNIMTKLENILVSFDSVGKTLDTKLPTLADKFELLEDQLDTVIKENKQPLNSALKSVDGFFKKGQGTIDKLDNYLNSVTQSRLDLGMDYFYMANDGQSRGVFRADYMPSYSRHYMIDVVSLPDYSEKDINGNYLANVDHAKSKFFVSAQVGKRYRDFMLRGGLIESTAGFGIDYYLYHDRLKLTMEAFDFRAVNDLRGKDLHLRALARYRFLKHIDAYIGADNMLNQDAFNIMFGMGVSFEDDRIKYLLGSSAGAFSSN